MKQSGFSLIELITVVAIIAILAAISVPSYSSYITKEKMRTVQSDLHLLSLRFEHRYQRVLSYPDTAYLDTDELENASFNKIADIKNWIPASDPSDFKFSTENATVTTYTIKATGVKGQFENCVIALTHDGKKTISNCESIAANGEWI